MGKATATAAAAAAVEPGSSKKQQQPLASVSDMFSFIWALDIGTRIICCIGIIAALGNAFVQPVIVFFFAQLLSKLAGAQTGLDDIRDLAFILMGIGAYALVVATLQTACFEIVAHRAALSFRMQWFDALLRQDSAFFDVHNVSGLASSFQSDCTKFQRGLGRKLGAGIENGSLFFIGIAFAFYSAWQIALIFICGVPFAVFFTLGTVRTNKDKGTRSNAAYSKAGSITYTTVSSVRTVFSLNAVSEMIVQYQDATKEAFDLSIIPLWKQGFYFGGLFATFMCLFCVVTLVGTVILQKDVRDIGCDPSESGFNDLACSPGGSAIYQAMLYFTFSAVGISQFGNFLESFTPARVAAYPAIQTIRRKAGAPSEQIYEEFSKDSESDEPDDPKNENESGGKRLKAIVPQYLIDSSAAGGLKPSQVEGLIEFKNVHFKYPTRPTTKVLDGLDLVIEAGKTTALVGASGGGKSTTVALIERFYDPLEGSVSLDGINVKDINVGHLRSLLGYVGQEPTLFATTIAGNIMYGKSSATQEEIEAAARSANAHDFIMSFPDGYNTQVGDKGAQLSGGQKQRIAIARVLVSEPSVLILDEATSALDSESELVVQDALDSLVEERNRTTVVIAHRLSTVRNADKIAVINGGKVVEQGTHDELIANNGPYCTLVNKQELRSSSNSNSSTDLTKLDENVDVNASLKLSDDGAHFEFKNIHFAYPSRPKRKIFDDFSLKIKTGETVALVGPSGGGKSTVVALVERFYDPLQGSVNYRGCDVQELNLPWYRDQIGYVGQEPTLFNTTIAKNIAYGAPSATQEEVEEAARQANIHSTILAFPDGYNTTVGERGTQLSGGQKQRIAIARALVKKPSVLLLDEATSALDTDSEAIVQKALDELMTSSQHTTIVIAHRLSTIQSADRIAFIAKGKVLEYASHEELMALPNGRYRRLVDSQNRSADINAAMLRLSAKNSPEDEQDDSVANVEETDETDDKMPIGKLARRMALPDTKYMIIGGICAIFAGAVFPAWGYMYAQMIGLLFSVVPACIEGENPNQTCQEIYDETAEAMREKSYELGGYWAIVALSCLFGNMVTFWGFGMASERLNKRIRDDTYGSLVRQEVGYFDVRSVGSITSLLQDDASRIQTFSGEPIRTVLIALSSLICGLILAFSFMWPVALVAVGCVPFVGVASTIEAQNTQGKDQKDEVKDQDELHSPGGIIVETLLNIRTVAALSLEGKRSKDLEEALRSDRKNYVLAAFVSGLTTGLAVLTQNWSNALQMWFGGWVLFNYPNTYTFNDFLIAFLGVLFSMVGLGSAVSGLSDMKVAEESAKRVFQLLDRKSEIDSLSKDGKNLN